MEKSNIHVPSPLPSIIKNSVSSQTNFYKLAMQFQQMIMVYESGIKQIETKLDILNKENKIAGRRNSIETVKSRIKTPQSIIEKLEKKGLPISFTSMMENLNDIAGIRVICPYISDIYNIKNMLLFLIN